MSRDEEKSKVGFPKIKSKFKTNGQRSWNNVGLILNFIGLVLNVIAVIGLFLHFENRRKNRREKLVGFLKGKSKSHARGQRWWKKVEIISLLLTVIGLVLTTFLPYYFEKRSEPSQKYIINTLGTIDAQQQSIETQIAFVNTSAQLLMACSGVGCNGFNPATAGCGADAYTVQTAVFSNSYVELRYSPTCGTYWGRVMSKIGATNLTIRIQREEGMTYTFSGGNFNYMWVPMVYAPNGGARACGGVNTISGCTAFV